MFEYFTTLGKNITIASLLTLTIQHTTVASSIQWEQWTVQAGGNGNWYGVTEERLNWDTSFQLATTLASSSGQPVQLAEINSAVENQFLVDAFQDTRPGFGWIGFTDSDAVQMRGTTSHSSSPADSARIGLLGVIRSSPY